MSEKNPPEIAVIMPRTADGWLEQKAMDAARVQLARARRHRHADQGIAGRKLLDAFVAQIVLGPHQPVALLAASLPIEQEGGREVVPVE